MRNLIQLILLLLMLCSFPDLAKSTSVTITFESGTSIRIHKAESIQESFLSWKSSENPLKQMFYIYNYPDHIDQYKNLFYQGHYPWGIEDIYPQWRADMNAIDIEVQGIFYGQLDAMDIACIQFSFTEKSNSIQMGFLAKRIQGAWYPLESQLMSAYQDVMGFFGTFQPELAACLMNPALTNTSSEAAAKLKSQCAANDNTYTEACLYETAVTWGTSEEPRLREFEQRLFKNRMKQETDSGRSTRVQNNLKSYLQSLSIPEEAIRNAMYYFDKHENLKAIHTLYANGMDMDSKALYDTLNQLQETTQYRSIERLFDEKPKSD